MNEAQQQPYPLGNEYRTPPPRGILIGILLGGLLGLALTENPDGAIAGGALSAAMASKPVELRQARFAKNLPS